MAYVIAAPEMMAAAAADLATIGSNVSAAHKVPAAPTVAVVPAATDEVSAAIAHVFSQHTADYQAIAARAAAFNDQFVQRLTAGAFSYASMGSLLRHGENAWLRGTYRVGRGDAVTAGRKGTHLLRTQDTGDGVFFSTAQRVCCAPQFC